ncbi:cytochrome-c peroxidase [Shewanella sp. 3_MG-2023]|uniref:cytochrome-c peroxidase n=1 Tax=Shewanella sp. 3_MG-2023 TaxID=3062635 RepID=UPI0026E4065F|nr:cytochrome-c peroxidase [Shewanella sp. 3_MG-2023]MDO6775654.1 cytochrome-c peroxidase [Shewanella sp. 3_MG-2023]
MYKKYYILIISGILICSVVPATVYMATIGKKAEKSHTKTHYYFEKVDSPIQPIPRRLEIDKQWLILGKALFHSPLLSKNNTISCSSCHLLDFGGDDSFPVSIGVNNGQGVRNSPTVLNSVFNFRQFWDGRAASLREQIEGPIHNPVEMGSTWPEIIKKLKQDSYFSETFQDLSYEGITSENIIKAITTFEESLITPNAPIDRYLLGDKTALTDQQKRGLNYFINYGCSTCHQGRNIGGNIFQKLGRINTIPKKLTLDLGKFEVTGLDKDKYVFKVPSLRNITVTGPYFHNGAVESLTEAVRIMASSQLGRQLTDSELDDIVALLHAFTSQVIEVNYDD